MATRVRVDFRRVDVLINNAGYFVPTPLLSMTSEEFDAVMHANLRSVFLVTRAFAPAMAVRKTGDIFVMASVASVRAFPAGGAYVTAKHGVLGLTKTAALELARTGVTCNAICPSYVKTPLVEAQIPDTMKARGMTKEQVIEEVMLSAQPTKEFVTVDQVAALAVFLCSDAASQITGANLSMDGGWTAQ